MNNISFFVQYSKIYKGLKLPGVLEIGNKQKLSHQTKLVLAVILVGNGLI